MLFDVSRYERKKNKKESFINRIRPFVEKTRERIKNKNLKSPLKVYFGAMQRELGLLLSSINIGACVSPTTKKYIDAYAFYFLDNGAFRSWIRGESFNERSFYSLLELSLKSDKSPDFVVLPDLIGQGLKSLDFSSRYADELKGTFNLALALQDGMEKSIDSVVDFVETYDVKVLFIGGTTEWKWKTANFWNTLAKRLSIKCHIGRVPSPKRLKTAKRLKVDSVDTTAVLWEERKFVSYIEELYKETKASQLELNFREER